MSNLITKTLSEVYHIDEPRGDYGFVSDFTCLWAIFENRFRSGTQTLGISRLKQLFQFQILWSIDIELPPWILSSNNGSDFFISFPPVHFKASLLPKGIQETKLAEEFFRDSPIEDDQPKKLKLFLFAIYRVRNNLLHGNKELQTLLEQKVFFEVLNNMFSGFLIKTKDMSPSS